MSLFKSSAVVGSFTLLSRVLGFVRDMLVAHVLGAGMLADAFIVAQRMPGLFRRVLAEGAFNVAFIPLLARYQTQGDTTETQKFLDAVFAGLFWVSLALTGLGMAAMPFIVTLLAPGFLKSPDTFALAVSLSQITFCYLVFIVFVSFAGGVLNSTGRFAAAAGTPALLNAAFIVCLWLLPPYTPTPAHAAAWAMVAGGVLQCLLMIVMFRASGYRLRLKLPHKHAGMGPLFRRMGPATIGVGMQQISSVVDTLLASLLMTGSVSYLYYADRLNQLPLALVGIALSTALLPHLSKALKQPDGLEASRVFAQTSVAALTLALAAAIGLFALADELMSVLFERGAFTAHDAHMSALALMAYSVGLPAFILVKITSTAFFAAEDTKTPVTTGFASLGVCIALSVALMQVMGHTGLALASSLAAWLNVLVQLYLLQRRKLFPHWDVRALGRDVGRMLAVTVAMAGALFGWKWALALPATDGLQALWLAGVIAVTGVVFLIGIHVSGLLNLRQLAARAKARRGTSKS